MVNPIDAQAIRAALDAATTPLPGDARMDGYYIGFTRTGIGVIDAVLSAVAVAGKGAHHTADWGDSDEDGYYDGRPGLPANPVGFDPATGIDGGSALALIQRTANASAEAIRVVTDALAALCARLEAAEKVVQAADAYGDDQSDENADALESILDAYLDAYHAEMGAGR